MFQQLAVPRVAIRQIAFGLSADLFAQSRRSTPHSDSASRHRVCSSRCPTCRHTPDSLWSVSRSVCPVQTVHPTVTVHHAIGYVPTARCPTRRHTPDSLWSVSRSVCPVQTVHPTVTVHHAIGYVPVADPRVAICQIAFGLSTDLFAQSRRCRAYSVTTPCPPAMLARQVDHTCSHRTRCRGYLRVEVCHCYHVSDCLG